jgi:hypothetical protein
MIYREKITTANEYLKKRVNEYVGESLMEEHATISKQQPISMRKATKYIDDEDSDLDDY